MTTKYKNFPFKIYALCHKCDEVIRIKISVAEHDCIKTTKKTAKGK